MRTAKLITSAALDEEEAVNLINSSVRALTDIRVADILVDSPEFRSLGAKCRPEDTDATCIARALGHLLPTAPYGGSRLTRLRATSGWTTDECKAVMRLLFLASAHHDRLAAMASREDKGAFRGNRRAAALGRRLAEKWHDMAVFAIGSLP